MSNIHINLYVPFLWYSELHHSSAYSSSLHSHPAWQLTLAVKGDFFFIHGEKKDTISPGEWILIAPGTAHISGSASSDSCAIQMFFRHFPTDLLPEFARSFNFLTNCCISGSFPAEKISATRKAFMRAAGNTFIAESLKKLLPLNFIVDAIGEKIAEISSGQSLPEGFAEILKFMEENFASSFGVADFANFVNLSESRFNAVFRNFTGMSPMQYFNEIRIAHAQSCLLAGEGVNAAAEKSGFASASYFCRKFKKYCGMTPGEFCRERKLFVSECTT